MKDSPEEKTNVTSKSPWEQILHRFKKNRFALFCLGLFLALVILSFAVPLLSPHSMDKPLLDNRFQPPSLTHPFGTDALGIDMFTKSFAGLRVTLTVGIVATFICLLIGVIYGSISGYNGGYIDQGMMRFVDVLYGLPYIAYIILIVFVFRPYGAQYIFTEPSGLFSRHNIYLWEIFLMTLAMGSIMWLTIARIVRGEVLSLRKLEYVESARAIGAGSFRILFRHIVPNLIGPIIVYATLTAPNVMLFESFISFLGLGIKPPHPSLGRIISDDALARIAATNLYWWLLLFPGALLAIVLFCLNIIGDGLRDAFDVREVN